MGQKMGREGSGKARLRRFGVRGSRPNFLQNILQVRLGFLLRGVGGGGGGGGGGTERSSQLVINYRQFPIVMFGFHFRATNASSSESLAFSEW